MIRFKITGVSERDIERHSNVPSKYSSYRLPSTRVYAEKSPVADILYQETTIRGCTQSNIRFFIKGDCQLLPFVTGPFSAINCMLRGSVVVFLRESLSVELLQGQYNLYQVDESSHLAQFSPGYYEAHHFDYDREAIQQLAHTSPIVKKWLDLIDDNAATPVLPYPGIVTGGMYRMIEEMKYLETHTELEKELFYNRLLNVLILFLMDQERRDYSFFSDGSSLYETIKGYIEAHLDSKVTLEQLSEAYNVSVSTLKKGFVKYFGMPFSKYLLKAKMDKANEMLKLPGQSINRVASALGYDFPGNFSQAYKRYFGYLPLEMALGSGDNKMVYLHQ